MAEKTVQEKLQDQIDMMEARLASPTYRDVQYRVALDTGRRAINVGRELAAEKARARIEARIELATQEDQLPLATRIRLGIKLSQAETLAIQAEKNAEKEAGKAASTPKDNKVKIIGADTTPSAL